MIFKPKRKTHYTTNNSDLAIEVVKIRRINEEKDYVKFVGILYNKKNGTVYEGKNYKVKLSMIQHWIRI